MRSHDTVSKFAYVSNFSYISKCMHVNGALYTDYTFSFSVGSFSMTCSLRYIITTYCFPYMTLKIDINTKLQVCTKLVSNDLL